MASVKVYVEKRNDKEGILIEKNVPIILSFSFDGQRLIEFTGERIDINKWDTAKQRVKKSVGGSLEVNALIESLENEVLQIYREAKISRIQPTPKYIKEKLSKNQKIIIEKNIFDYFKEFIEGYKNKATIATIKKFNTTQTHLKNFSSFRKEKTEFSKIDDTFLNGFVDYCLNELGHTNNTVSTYINTIKWFLNWATDKGVNNNIRYKKFVFGRNETEIIALSYEELMQLYNCDLKKDNLKQIRDVFCFGSFTSLRYSDINNLKKTDIIGDNIIIKSIKTKSQLQIPLNDYSKEIIKRYEHYPIDKCLPVISNQKMNLHLKEIGELAGIDTPTKLVSYRGAQRIEEVFPKYE